MKEKKKKKHLTSTLICINHRMTHHIAIRWFVLRHISDIKSNYSAYSAPPAHVLLQTDYL